MLNFRFRLSDVNDVNDVNGTFQKTEMLPTIEIKEQKE